jgi:membrane protease YdiL (CAAX protease family)
LGKVAEPLDLSSHWTEWFDEDLIWGGAAVVTVSLVEYVLFAPLFEELVFRGLLFATLRRRFGFGLSATLSAAIFALAHGYGLLGFASVIFSGLLWAWVYEKTGSLLPGMAAHALNNLMVCLTEMWLLR